MKAYNAKSKYNKRNVRYEMKDPYFAGTYYIDTKFCFEEDVQVIDDNRYVYLCVKMKPSSTVVDDIAWGIIFNNGYFLSDMDKSKYSYLQKDLASFMSKEGITNPSYGFDIGEANKQKILESKIGIKVRDAVDDMSFTFYRDDEYYKRIQDKSIFPSIIYDSANDNLSCVSAASYKAYRDKYNKNLNNKNADYIMEQTAQVFLRTGRPYYFNLMPHSKSL